MKNITQKEIEDYLGIVDSLQDAYHFQDLVDSLISKAKADLEIDLRIKIEKWRFKNFYKT